jgi:hypothetical protein
VKGKDLKNEGVKISIKGKEVEIRFDMNIFCELEEIYDNPMDVISDLGRGSFKATRAIIWANYKKVKPGITVEEVGEMFDMESIIETANKMYDLINESLPDVEDDEVTDKEGE